MTPKEFTVLSKYLRTLSEFVPLIWETTPNNKTNLKINTLEVDSFKRLESEIILFPEKDKNYFRKRWFLWECSRCDEYLFSINKNVIQNTNLRDQTYNIEFNNDPNLRFDIKGTVIPKSFRTKAKEVLQDPTEMIHFIYNEQNKGTIDKNHNHLFVIHYSHIAPERELRLKCLWDFKAVAYKKYAEKITSTSNFITYNNTISDVIFIVENEDQTISYHFYSV